MSDVPLISIVVPTRNRPDSLLNAVNSLCDQGFSGLEVIVSDNSDAEYAIQNKQALDEYPSFVRYVSPSSVLAMVSHWEWAVSQACGSYVGILTDRMVYKKGAIPLVAKIVEAKRPKLLVYGFDELAGVIPPYRYVRGRDTGNISEVGAREIFKACEGGTSSNVWPRMMNCICENAVLDELREHYGSVFSGIAPDYSFCFRVVDWLGKYVALDNALVISTATHKSNGKQFYSCASSDTKEEFIRHSEAELPLSDRNILTDNLIPWQTPIQGNIELLEYLLAREKQVSGLLGPINYRAYYRVQFQRLLWIRFKRGDTSAGDSALDAYRKHHRIRDPKAWLTLLYFGGFVIRAVKGRIIGRVLWKRKDSMFFDVWEAREDNPVVVSYEPA